MILVTNFLSATEELALSYRRVSSRNVSRPQFSIAPASKSGMATKSGHNKKEEINFLSKSQESLLSKTVTKSSFSWIYMLCPLLSAEEHLIKPFDDQKSHCPLTKKTIAHFSHNDSDWSKQDKAQIEPH